MQLDGKIIAPTSSGAWGKGLQHWIEFKNLKGITFKGSGTLDGQGSVWWKDLQTSDPSEVDSHSDDMVIINNSIEALRRLLLKLGAEWIICSFIQTTYDPKP